MILPIPQPHGHPTRLITVSSRPGLVTGSPAVCHRHWGAVRQSGPRLTRTAASGICMCHRTANMSTRLHAFAFSFPLHLFPAGKIDEWLELTDRAGRCVVFTLARDAPSGWLRLLKVTSSSQYLKQNLYLPNKSIQFIPIFWGRKWYVDWLFVMFWSLTNRCRFICKAKNTNQQWSMLRN